MGGRWVRSCLTFLKKRSWREGTVDGEVVGADISGNRNEQIEALVSSSSSCFLFLDQESASDQAGGRRVSIDHVVRVVKPMRKMKKVMRVTERTSAN
jgi:hypothetical protein